VRCEATLARSLDCGLDWGSMPWNNAIWWIILLVIGLLAYVTYLQLAPMD